MKFLCDLKGVPGVRSVQKECPWAQHTSYLGAGLCMEVLQSLTLLISRAGENCVDFKSEREREVQRENIVGEIPIEWPPYGSFWYFQTQDGHLCRLYGAGVHPVKAGKRASLGSALCTTASSCQRKSRGWHGEEATSCTGGRVFLGWVLGQCVLLCER